VAHANYTLNSLTPTSFMSILLLYSKTLGNKCSQYTPHSLLSHSLPYITCLEINVKHRRIQTTHSHASHCHHCNYCHYCNVDVVLFHNVTCYTNPLLSCTRVNTTYLLNIMCTLVATCMILGRLDCSSTLLFHPQ
jgi:hypothetical protein